MANESEVALGGKNYRGRRLRTTLKDFLNPPPHLDQGEAYTNLMDGSGRDVPMDWA